MPGRLKELADSTVRSWFALLITLCLGLFAADRLVANSKLDGWFWVAICSMGLVLVELRVAYNAMKERDEARGVAGVHEGRSNGAVIFHGGEHTHHYHVSSSDSDASQHDPPRLDS
jgi:hypothetical protein